MNSEWRLLRGVGNLALESYECWPVSKMEGAGKLCGCCHNVVDSRRARVLGTPRSLGLFWDVQR